MNDFIAGYAEGEYFDHDLDGFIPFLSTSLGATEILLQRKFEKYVKSIGST